MRTDGDQIDPPLGGLPEDLQNGPIEPHLIVDVLNVFEDPAVSLFAPAKSFLDLPAVGRVGLTERLFPGIVRLPRFSRFTREWFLD